MSGMSVVEEPSEKRQKLGFIAYMAASAQLDREPYEKAWKDSGPHLREYWCAIADAVAIAAIDEHALMVRHGRFHNCPTCKRERETACSPTKK